MYIREDEADIRVSVDGVPYGESWATLSGGELSSNDAKTRPGGMGKEVSVGGPATRSDLTATVQFDEIVAGWHKRLESRVGKGVAEVNITWLDKEGTPIAGSGFKRVGSLKSVAEPPATNSDSPTVGMYTLVVSCNEQAA
jgi:hypothetical protein